MAHCGGILLRKTLGLIQWVPLCLQSYVNVHAPVCVWIYVHGHVHKQLLLGSYEHALYPAPPPTYHLVCFFSVASYQLAGDPPFLFSAFFYHCRTRFHFLFSIQNRNVTSFSACPPTHTHVRTKDTHRETELRAPRGHAFFCLPVSNIKNNDWRETLKKECWRKGRWGREEDLSALMDEGNTCCVLCRCVFERQSSLSARETGGEGRRGRSEEETDSL